MQPCGGGLQMDQQLCRPVFADAQSLGQQSCGLATALDHVALVLPCRFVGNVALEHRWHKGGKTEEARLRQRLVHQELCERADV